MRLWLAATLVSFLSARPAAAGIATNTETVEALLLHDDMLWVATRGGLEAYDIDGARQKLLTVEDGLAESWVRELTVERGRVIARTQKARCELGERVECRPAPTMPTPTPAVAASFQGARVTARLGDFVGTAGKGVWKDGPTPRRLTPENQICSNHVMAIAPFRGAVYLGTFDEGLCAAERDTFRRVAGPFRMVNDLVVAKGKLYLASSEGLFVSRDGRRFDRILALKHGDGGYNDLAVDGNTLYATFPGGLVTLPLGKGKARPRVTFRPGGSASVQAVEAAGGVVWVATEDKGGVRLAGAETRLFDRAAGLPSSWVLDVAVAADAVYLATLRHGLVRVTPDGKAAPVAGLENAWLLHVSIDPDGSTVWIGTQGGLFRWRAGVLTPITTLPHPNVHVVRHFGRQLWVGTEGGVMVVHAR